MADQSPQHEVQQPSRKARLGVALLLLSLAASIPLLNQAIQALGPATNADAAQIDAAIARYQLLLDGLLGVSVIFSAAMSWYFIRLARRTREAGRYPPPGTTVIKPTRIREGERINAPLRAAWLMAVFCWFPLPVILLLKWWLANLI